MKIKSYEITAKKYTSEYKETRKIEANGEYEMMVLKNIVTRKNCLAAKKNIVRDEQCQELIKMMESCLHLYDLKEFSKFVGYSVFGQSDGVKKKQNKWIVFVFEYCDISLETVIKMVSKLNSKSQSTKLINLINKKLLDAFALLESKPQIDLKLIPLDFNLIILSNYGQVNQQFQLIYLPFPVLDELMTTRQDFKQKVYSTRQLRLINRVEREKLMIPNSLDEQEVILESERETESPSYNRDLLQKMGLLLLKILYILSQQLPIEQFTLYTMNEHFNVDFNWQFINEFISQCQNFKEYSQIAKTIRYMVSGCQQELSFRQYSQIISRIKTETSNKHKRDHQVENHGNIYIRQFSESEDSNLFNENIQISKSHTDLSKNPKLKVKQIEQIIIKSTICQRVNYQDGSYYRGEMKNEVRDGQGIYQYVSGQIYAGGWKNDQMNGKGIFIFTNNEQYEGQVIDGVKQGYGTYYYQNGNEYSGNWHDDCKEGHGQFKCKITGEKYVGQFKQNLRDGRGIVYYSNKERFQGNFAKGMKEGQGYLYDTFGRIYLKGFWHNDIIEGSGQIFLPNGDNYIGQLRNNKMNGKGIYKYFNGTVYEGEFINNQQYGNCVIRYINGDVFEGEVVNCLYEGKGKYFYKAQDLIYEGLWSKGVENGQGSFYYNKTVKLSGFMNKGDLLTYTIKNIEQSS